MLLLPPKVTIRLPLRVTEGTYPHCYGLILSALARRTFGPVTYLSHLPCVAWVIGSMSNSVCVDFWSSYWGEYDALCPTKIKKHGDNIPGGVSGQAGRGGGGSFFGVPQKYVAHKNHHTNKPKTKPPTQRAGGSKNPRLNFYVHAPAGTRLRPSRRGRVCNLPAIIPTIPP